MQSEASRVLVYIEGFVDPQSHIQFLYVALGDCVGAPHCADNVAAFVALLPADQNGGLVQREFAGLGLPHNREVYATVRALNNAQVPRREGPLLLRADGS